MSKSRLCCFTVNTTHACIIANNFINNNLDNVKIIYINEKEDNKKLKTIISKFYKNIEDRMYYSEWLNESILNDYVKEKFVFVVHGKEKFVDNVNSFLDINEFNGHIINCYDVYDINSDIASIIERHDHYVNTTGIVAKLDNYFNKIENKDKLG